MSPILNLEESFSLISLLESIYVFTSKDFIPILHQQVSL